jgi:Zn-finger nucleic acid-binding protein
VANCCNCSAPLPANSIRCEYCGSRNDIDLKGVHYNTTHKTDSDRICPRCSTALETIDLQIEGRFLIERCEQCLGLFFDPGELDALLQATVANVFTVNRGEMDVINATMRANDYPVCYLKCPVCTKLMNRVNFGAKSGVVVNRCKDHGVWLDGGDLRHLFEWMKAGGKLLEQERGERKLAEAERKQQPHSPAGWPAGDAGNNATFDGYSGNLRNDDPDLFDMVLSAIRFFTR